MQTWWHWGSSHGKATHDSSVPLYSMAACGPNVIKPSCKRYSLVNNSVPVKLLLISTSPGLSPGNNAHLTFHFSSSENVHNKYLCEPRELVCVCMCVRMSVCASTQRNLPTNMDKTNWRSEVLPGPRSWTMHQTCSFQDGPLRHTPHIFPHALLWRPRNWEWKPNQTATVADNSYVNTH